MMMLYISRARKIFLGFALAAALLAASCYRGAQTPSSVHAPENGALGWYPRYAVVQESYLRVFAQQREDAAVQSFMRRGDIAEILEISGADEDGYIWYRVALVAPDAAKTAPEASKNSDASGSVFEPAKGWILSRGAVRVQSMEQARFLSKTFAPPPNQDTGLRTSAAARDAQKTENGR